jgi:hypothetical protein
VGIILLRFFLSHIHEEVQINNNIGKAIMLIVIPVNSVTNIITVLDVSKVSKIRNNEDKLKVNIHSDKKVEIMALFFIMLD